MSFTHTLRTDTPSGKDDPREADDRIREAKAAFVERFATDHYIPESSSNTYDDPDTGEHEKVTLRKQDSSPTSESDKGFVFAKEVNGKVELFYIDSNGNEKQITTGGKLNISSSDIPDDSINEDHIQLSNNRWLMAKNAAGNGEVGLIGVDVDDIVRLPHGTRVGIGTPQSGAIATQYYVSQRVAFLEYQTTDSEGNSLSTGYDYKVTGDGFLIIKADGSNAGTVTVYVDATLPVSEIVAKEYCLYSVTIVLPIQAEKYFRIVPDFTASFEIRYVPIYSGNCVKQ